MALALSPVATPLLAAPAHEHGVAHLDVALVSGRLEVVLETPLDNLLGFERAPRNDAERRSADQAVARLRDAARMLQPDPAAGCVAEPTDVQAPVLGLGPVPAGGDGHAELQASWAFQCKAPPAHLDLRLFESFGRLRSIEAQVVTAKGQRKARLTPAARRVMLAR